MDAIMTDNTFDYEQMDLEERPFAARLALWIQRSSPERVIDLGAGTGVYVEELRRVGIPAQGYDITDPQPRPDLVETVSMLDVRDSAPVVMCLEVAEHIDGTHSRAVIEAVWRTTQPQGRVIWSAAQPGQGGVGHINCQAPEYWQQLAHEQGFVSHDLLHRELVEWITQGYHMGWFRQNCQVWLRP